MTSIGVITFQELGSGFAHHMLFGWDHLMVDGPMVGVVGAPWPSDPFPQSPKGSMITATHHPGDTTP